MEALATSNVVLTQVTLSTIFAGLLAYLKKARWVPFITQHSAAINHVYLLLVSGGTALGVHSVWDSQAHSLLITGLSLTAIAHGFWEWTKQWTVQYLVQRGIFGPLAIPGDAPPIPTVPVKAGLILATVLTFSLALSSCAARVASTAGTPARNATPVEKALAYNASLAETNKTIAQIVMDANSQTPPLLTTEITNKVLIVQSRVADFDRQLSPLLVDAATVSANSAKIHTLVNEIKLAASSVQPDLGIKDAATQKKISDAAGQISSFADLALGALVQGGILQ
jgi:hypothetical protein